jgi:hypothetical protein
VPGAEEPGVGVSEGIVELIAFEIVVESCVIGVAVEVVKSDCGLQLRKLRVSLSGIL